MKGSVSVRRSIKILVWVWVLAVAGSPCAAQPQQDTPSATEGIWAPLRGRLAFHVSGAFQASGEQLWETFSFRAYGETARFEARHEINGGACPLRCGWPSFSVATAVCGSDVHSAQ